MSDDVDEGSAAMRGSVANYPEIPDSCTLTKAERDVLERLANQHLAVRQATFQVCAETARQAAEVEGILRSILERLK